VTIPSPPIEEGVPQSVGKLNNVPASALREKAARIDASIVVDRIRQNSVGKWILKPQAEGSRKKYATTVNSLQIKQLL
jgi:hypothetical protein